MSGELLAAAVLALMAMVRARLITGTPVNGAINRLSDQPIPVMKHSAAGLILVIADFRCFLRRECSFTHPIELVTMPWDNRCYNNG